MFWNLSWHLRKQPGSHFLVQHITCTTKHETCNKRIQDGNIRTNYPISVLERKAPLWQTQALRITFLLQQLTEHDREWNNKETFQHYTAPIQCNLEHDDRLYSCEHYKALNLYIRVGPVSALKHCLGQLSYARRGKRWSATGFYS